MREILLDDVQLAVKEVWDVTWLFTKLNLPFDNTETN